MASILEFSPDEWLSAFKQTIGSKDSYCFVPLSAAAEASDFERLLAALLAGRLAVAEQAIADLDTRGVRYTLIRVHNGDANPPLYGFMERVLPGALDYRGWGAALVRPGGTCHTVYQAPHPQSDRWTDNITLRAFVDDPRGAVALFAGTNRYANGRTPARADVAHKHDNLFHTLSAALAVRGQAAGRPAWFVQLHGSEDRRGQPAVTASHGVRLPFLDGWSILPEIEQHVRAEGNQSIGVCGRRQKSVGVRTRRYVLCGTGNTQGLMLEQLGLRHTFLHFELARTMRAAYQRGAGSGHAGVLGLLAAIRSALSRPAQLAGSASP